MREEWQFVFVSLLVYSGDNIVTRSKMLVAVAVAVAMLVVVPTEVVHNVSLEQRQIHRNNWNPSLTLWTVQ